ncbi:protein Dok-7 isoform X11 [Macaca fascicularis]|uniref:protein Dok-7 isoform X11 n=1 Tax=Macaca fascicularis TaxID=9541 RepID=UPI0032B03F08
MTSSSWPGTSPRLSWGSGSCPTSGATGPCRADSSLKAGPGVGTGLVSSSCPRPRGSRSASCSTASSEASPPPRAPLGCGRFSQPGPSAHQGAKTGACCPAHAAECVGESARSCQAEWPVGSMATSSLCWEGLGPELAQPWLPLPSTLPGTDPSPPGPSTVEERVAQEALETLQLEKRLSLLSHAGRPGSGGDDRSLSSSSSEASHLDVSASSRLTAWPEQSLSSASTSQEGPRPAAAQAPGEAMLGASRPPPKPLRPRQLQEVGRQSSSDSGIATGSHSSYSGSLSSYAGSSLDVWRATDELGSLLSLPAAGAPEPSLCACLPGAVEYQVPTSLRPHYDTPRSLRLVPRDHSPASQGSPGDSAAGDSGGQTSAGCPSGWLGTRRRGLVMEAPQGSEATLPSPAPGEPWEAGSPHAGPSPAFFSACPVCGGLKGVAASAPGPVTAHSGSPGPVAVDSPGPERPCGEPPAYVNIPVSPPSGKQLHYMGLELQEASEGVRGASASLYAQIDIAATEMAHRVGAQHARAREEQLSELEQRKAAPQ